MGHPKVQGGVGYYSRDSENKQELKPGEVAIHSQNRPGPEQGLIIVSGSLCIFLLIAALPAHAATSRSNGATPTG